MPTRWCELTIQLQPSDGVHWLLIENYDASQMPYMVWHHLGIRTSGNVPVMLHRITLMIAWCTSRYYYLSTDLICYRVMKGLIPIWSRTVWNHTTYTQWPAGLHGSCYRAHVEMIWWTYDISKVSIGGIVLKSRCRSLQEGRSNEHFVLTNRMQGTSGKQLEIYQQKKELKY